MFRKLEWDNKGIVINGVKINHLRFADDIVLITGNVTEMQEMLNQLSDESKVLGLKMNMKKTKVMFNKYINENIIQVNNNTIEHVEEYVYLGQLVTMESDKTNEIKRRIGAAWSAFGKY